jgi:hypothetical protein
MFKRIIVVFLTLTWVISSCSGSKDETIKTPPKIVQDSTNIIFREFEDELKKLNDKLVSDSLNLDNINDSKILWKNTLSEYTKHIFKNSNVDVNILSKYVTNEIDFLPNDILKNLTNNQISILSELKSQDVVFNLELNSMVINYKKILSDKVTKYEQIVGHEKYTDLYNKLKEKKISEEEFFKELENLPP